MQKLTTIAGLMMVVAAPLLAASKPPVPLTAVYENLTPEQTLERDIQRDLAAISNPGNGGKVQDVRLAQANAKKALANDQAALEAFKTAGPKSAIPYLEESVREDQYAIDHWGTGSKLPLMMQARQSAVSKLAEDQSTLDKLRAE
jgi:hypothetical protein